MIIFSKPHTLIMITFFFFFFISLISSSVAADFNDQSSILLSIKSSLVDPLNHLEDWKQPDEKHPKNPHCNWTGIVCNSFGSIEKLDLSKRNLTGTVSDEIGLLRTLVSINLSGNGFSTELPRSVSNLTALRSVDLSQNYFIGKFPDGFGMAVGLTVLNASSNNFSGNVPEDLGNNTGLETLDLRGNFFVGSVPVSFGNLRKLRFLGLSGNNLTGSIPKEIGGLSALESIVIGYNEFSGGIPVEFGNLTNLRYLDLAYGNLGGEIPVELGNLKKLEAMFLYKNNLKGKIPSEIGKLTFLTQLDLSDNMLSGEIPAEVSALKNLQLFNVMSNRLSGSIPDGIASLPQLGILELWNNSFSGSLPDDLGFDSPLEWVDVSSNSFTGRIPENLCRRGNLTKLILFNNGFSGPIPAGLSTCNSLVRVRMQNNSLSGTIPVGFGSLERLQRLELADNNLTGQIPNDITSSTSLSFIDFSGNQLESGLPSLIFTIPNLQNFLVSDNKLVGKIPSQFQDCPSLSILDLSSNDFTGTIPASIASCQKLVYLNLRNNQLSGEIPIPISTMGTLAVLDLSNNSLTGGIPETFGNSPALESLNVSHNRLQGPVPANGMLRTINPSDLIGNDGLCGNVLPPCNGNRVSNSHHKGLHHVVAGWVIGMSTILAVLLAAFAGKILFDKWYTNGGCFEERFEMGKGEWPWRLMAFQKLDFNSHEILNSVKESNVIGMGATGVVYKAEIHRNNTIVAVKKLWSTKTDIELGSTGGEFVREVDVLGKLRHRNIVRLLGFLYNDKNAMIVYEYMTNGSLGEALHGHGGRLLVDWVLRYNIAVGVAQGLAYLHHDCHPPVIHRDVKPNNILLDGNLEARIADFGLARMVVKKNETVSMVAGSYGYIAPEYGYTLKVDEKSDIYSYGVVLMELITGKRPVEPEYGDSVDIVEWVRRKVRDNKPLTEVVDPNVGNCKHVEEEMLLVLRIALICTARLPKDRPSMRDVVSMLEEARPRRKSSSNTNKGNEKDRPMFSPSPVNGLL